MPRRLVAITVLALAAACGRAADPTPTASPPKDGAAPADTTTVPEVHARGLGEAQLEDFAWRHRAGRSAYAAARQAEHREDWASVVTACRQALAADPLHLDAAWLLAVALAKTGHLDQVLPPLQIAVAGDLGKWGNASLEQPALQPFLASPIGAAWRRRLDDDHATYAAALARSIIVLASGDLFAFDAQAPRWYRLTRTGGNVIAALASPSKRDLVYITRAHTKGTIGGGLVNLSTGRSSRPVPLGTSAALAIAWGTAEPAGAWIGAGTTWRQLDADGKLHPLPAGTPRPPGPWLEIAGGGARLHRLPVADVAADWDDRTLASSIRVGTSNRVISVPSPGLIDGNTATWSPDRAHLAFVAQLDEQCTPGAISAAAFVADTATGKVAELERAAGGLAVDWIDASHLAVAGDHGVSVVPMGDGTPTLVAANASLPSPRRAPRCTLPAAPGEPKPGDDEPADDEPTADPAATPPAPR